MPSNLSLQTAFRPVLPLDSQFKMQFELQFEDWGLVEYEVAQTRQLSLLQKLSEDSGRTAIGTVVFCSHFPVVTLGRNTKAEDVWGWTGQICKSTRGGRATYHGPSQLIIYPILNLRKLNLGAVDLIRILEQTLIRTLAKFGIDANHAAPSSTSLAPPHSGTTEPRAELLETGVWAQGYKIASIGIAVKKWISYHGAALNLEYDPTAFQGLNPCGYESQVMTAIESLLGHKISRQSLISSLREEFHKMFFPKTYAFRLLPNQDLYMTLQEQMNLLKWKAAVVLTCVGSLSQASLRFAGATNPQSLEGPLEIVSLVGTLGPPGQHLHISLSNDKGVTIGGHLKPGSTVHTTAELVLMEVPGVEFQRLYDPATGFRELSIQSSLGS